MVTWGLLGPHPGPGGRRPPQPWGSCCAPATGSLLSQAGPRAPRPANHAGEGPPHLSGPWLVLSPGRGQLPPAPVRPQAPPESLPPLRGNTCWGQGLMSALQPPGGPGSQGQGRRPRCWPPFPKAPGALRGAGASLCGRGLRTEARPPGPEPGDRRLWGDAGPGRPLPESLGASCLKRLSLRFPIHKAGNKSASREL